MKLTDTQLVLLSAASQRQDHTIELRPKLKSSASREMLHASYESEDAASAVAFSHKRG